VFDSRRAHFRQRGFDGVSVDDIARDAGVNKAMIYYHFADKLALYRAVLADGLEPMGATVHAIASSPDTPPRSSIDSSKRSCA
jgi:AcrR family transcriptional regulator